MLKKIVLYYSTIKHLKPIQIRYRLWYILRNKIRTLTGHSYPAAIPRKGHHLKLAAGIVQPSACNLQSPTRFTFLNQSHTFEGEIAWNYSAYGKLWAYNLNYFDYLNQDEMGKAQGLELIMDFVDHIEINEQGMEPYPISLRSMNWIKFLSKNEIEIPEIDASLYAQYQILTDNIEYHIMGNHLLENGWALLFGAFYFGDESLLEQSKQILNEQLDEQILNDGAHFERSPMYHLIMFERLLDGFNLLINNKAWRAEEELRKKIAAKAELMLGWINAISFKNGDIPHVNDSAYGIAPEKKELDDYARRLGVGPEEVTLEDSGYRKFHNKNFELFMDVGKIGPDYQPAHAHSDTLSFELYYLGKPVIIDTGISTYEENKRRSLERSTAAHNTVGYGTYDQSEVWKSFRVGRRAKPISVAQDANIVKGGHDGYRPLNVEHLREWKISENEVLIKDSIEGDVNEDSTAYFHIHPDIEPLKKANHVFQVGDIILYFDDPKSSKIADWDFPAGFNLLKKGYKLEIVFRKKLTSYIRLSL